MAPVSAVLFDLDETLLDRDDAGHALGVHRVCTELGPWLPGVAVDDLARAFLDSPTAASEAAAGRVARASNSATDAISIWTDVWRSALARFGCHDQTVAAHAVRLYREERRRGYRLYGDVVRALGLLRALKLPMAVVTNGPGDAQREKIAATGLDKYLVVAVVSGEFGLAKPNPAIFRAAIAQLGVPALETWHVGDSVATDVVGAHNASLGAAVLVNRRSTVIPPRGPRPTHVVRSLDEAATLVRSHM